MAAALKPMGTEMKQITQTKATAATTTTNDTTLPTDTVATERQLRVVDLIRDGFGKRHLLTVRDGQDGNSVLKDLGDIGRGSRYRRVARKLLLGKQEAIFEGTITLVCMGISNTWLRS